MSERMDQAWNKVESALYHLEKTVNQHRRPVGGLKVATADIEAMKNRVDNLVGLIENRLAQNAARRPVLVVVDGGGKPHE